MSDRNDYDPDMADEFAVDDSLGDYGGPTGDDREEGGLLDGDRDSGLLDDPFEGGLGADGDDPDEYA